MNTTTEEITYDLELLEQSARAWQQSPGLRLVYENIYREIAAAAAEGPVLEIGSGIGVARPYFSQLTTSDVVQTPYVDRAMSAYAIEPAANDEPWATIFAVDVLHHLVRPMEFFESAASAVKEGGRLVLVEPAATAFGCIFYRLCHHEPIRPAAIQPPFAFEANGPDGEFANMGMGVGLFERNREACLKRLEDMGWRLQSLRYRDLLAYPATGGYSKRQILPGSLLRLLLRMERALPNRLMRLLGLRMVLVFERVNVRNGETE